MSARPRDEVSQCFSENESGRSPRIYENLPLPQSRSIRLLRLVPNGSKSDTRLCGNLEVVALADNPRYAALSYVWDHEESADDLAAAASESVIHCNNSELRITRNCYDALSSLLYLYGPIRIWVDAICINQEDEKEKASQIGIMTDIYTWAKTVYVWLGPGSSATDRAIDSLRRASSFRIYTPGIPWASNMRLSLNVDRFWLMCSILYFQIGGVFPPIQWIKAHRLRNMFNPHDINELLDSKWTQRAWTYQEIVFSSNPVIVCGRKTLTWTSLQNGIDYLQNPVPPFEHSVIKWLKVAVSFAKLIGVIDIVWPSDLSDVSDQLMRSCQSWKNMHKVWKNACRKTMCDDEKLRTLPCRSEEARNNTWSVAEYQEKFRNFRINWSLFQLITMGVLGFITINAAESVINWAISLFTRSDNVRCHNWSDGRCYAPPPLEHTLLLFVYWAIILTASYTTMISLFLQPLDKIYGRKDTTNQLTSAIMRALREREATKPADKAFALHEVFSTLDIRISSVHADYQRPTGKVYQALFLDLLRHRTSFINLLIDTNGPEAFPDVPSWVPDWTQTHKNDWDQSDFIYEHMEDYATVFAAPQMKISNNKLGLWAVRKDVVREPLSNMGIGSKPSDRYDLQKIPVKLARSFAQRISHAFERASAWIPDPASNRAHRIHCEVFRALIGRNPPSGDDQDPDIKILKRWVNLSQETSLSSGTLSAAFQDDDQLWPFMARCYRYVRSRVMFITAEGLYGTGPPGMAASDRIMWLKGVAIPMILRPVESGGSEFKVIGPAVVPGLMDLSVLNVYNYGPDWEVVYLI